PAPGLEDRRCLPQHLTFTGQVTGTAGEALVTDPCRLPANHHPYLPNATYVFLIEGARYTLAIYFATGARGRADRHQRPVAAPPARAEGWLGRDAGEDRHRRG